MRTYRVVKDSYAGYEAQFKYDWFPFMWFQLNEFHWINTWQTQEQAKAFITARKKSTKFLVEHQDSEYELARESKLLAYKVKNFSPEVVWMEEELPAVETDSKRRWWPVISPMNG